MSTRLHDGYLFSGDLGQFYRAVVDSGVVSKMHSEVADLKAWAVAEFLAREIVKSHSEDTYEHHGATLSHVLVEKAQDAFYTSVGLGQKSTFDFENVVYFRPNPNDESTVLVYLAFDNQNLSLLWVSSLGLKEYAYQNSTDRPESISESQWSERELAWRDLMEHRDFTRAGFFCIRPQLAPVGVLDLVLHGRNAEIWKGACDKAIRIRAEEISYGEYLSGTSTGSPVAHSVSTLIHFLECERANQSPRVGEAAERLTRQALFPKVSDLLDFKLSNQTTMLPAGRA